jgi:hypothetical protein
MAASAGSLLSSTIGRDVGVFESFCNSWPTITSALRRVSSYWGATLSADR